MFQLDTEIDWVTYMQQVEIFLSGERDYHNIKGNTGPLVYPAGFLYIFSVLYQATNRGQNILRAQYLFAILQSLTLYVILLLYRKALNLDQDQKNVALDHAREQTHEVRNHRQNRENLQSFKHFVAITLPLLLSKRINSIFTLRLFNDPIAMFFMYISILLLTKSKYTLASLFFSIALSIKMNVLLFTPGFALIQLEALGFKRAVLNGLFALLVQIILGIPFLLAHPGNYFGKAFEFSRTFLYQWTVNWRFVSPEFFQSSQFALLLLFLHISMLVVVVFRNGEGLFSLITTTPTFPVKSISSRRVVIILFSSNLIGIIFARSLHYQFHSWYFYTIPLLLFHSKLPLNTKIIVWCGIELGWSIFPATFLTSAILMASHLILLAGLIRKGQPIDSNIIKQD